jgi:hypothetical protein
VAADTLWVCADGRQVMVSHMADDHLHNCIAKILRSRTWRRQYLDRLLLEVEIRRITGKAVARGGY